MPISFNKIRQLKLENYFSNLLSERVRIDKTGMN